MGLKPKVMSEVYLPRTTSCDDHAKSPTSTGHIHAKFSMAESYSLPEQYENMSLGELHEEIHRMERLLRLLKEKVEVSKSRTSSSDTPDIDIRSTRMMERQTLPCRAEARAWEKPGWTRSLKIQEYKRYGRQMIMPEVGLSGMLESS